MQVFGRSMLNSETQRNSNLLNCFYSSATILPLFFLYFSALINIPNVTEIKEDMNLGLTLIQNSKTGGFLVCIDASVDAEIHEDNEETRILHSF